MHPLDNPIWQALTACQAQFAETRHSARRFPPSVISLGAIEEPTQAGYESLAHLLGAGEMTGLLLEALPAPPANWAVVEAVPLIQMVQKDCEVASPSARIDRIDRSGCVRDDGASRFNQARAIRQTHTRTRRLSRHPSNGKLRRHGW